MNPLTFHDEAINDADNKLVKKWLNQRESNIFQTYLVAMAARLTAEAGNLLVEDDEGNGAHAKVKIEDARLYMALADKLAEMRGDDTLVTVKITPTPIQATP